MQWKPDRTTDEQGGEMDLKPEITIKEISDRISSLRRSMDRPPVLDAEQSLPLPKTFNFILTHRCFFRCSFCAMWKLRDEDIDFKEWVRLIDEIYRETGPFHVRISGGECLMVPYLVDLVAYASSLGCETSFPTNAWLLDERMIARLDNAGLSHILISLDALGDLHDRLRGMPGAYQRVVSALGLIATMKPRFDTSILAVIMDDNLDLLPSLIDFCKGHKAVRSFRVQAIVQPFNTAADPNWYLNYPHWPKDIAKVDTVLDKLANIARKDHFLENEPEQIEFYRKYFRDPKSAAAFHCSVGEVIANIKADGQVAQCFTMGDIGSIRHQTFRECWNSEKAAEARRKIQRCHETCNITVNCNFSDNKTDNKESFPTLRKNDNSLHSG